MSREEPYYIPMPEIYGRRKLNALYREIPLKDATSRLLRKYFNAAANLYGSSMGSSPPRINPL